MGIDRKNDSSQSSKLLTYLGITVTFQLIGFVATYVYSSYFNRSSTFAQTFLFRSSDSPPVPLGFRRPSPFGNHFFGDFLDTYSQTKVNASGGYYGLSQLFLLFASKLPYYLALIGFLSVCIFVLYMAARFLLNEMGLPEQLALLAGACLFTQPALLAIDRGQMHLLLFALLMFGLTLIIKTDGNKTWGVILIAAAISMKLAPIFFLLLFVKKGYWRNLKVGLISLMVFMLLPMAYLNSGLGSWRVPLTLFEKDKSKQATYITDQYFGDNLAYNNSFKLLAYYFSQMGSVVGKVGSFVYDHYFLCAGFLCLLLGWLIIQANITQFEAFLLMAIASSLLIPISSAYTLLVFILPVVVVLGDQDFHFNRLNIVYCCVIGIVLMPKQYALGFKAFQDSSITLGGILNPGLSLLIVFFITGKCLYMSKGNFFANRLEADVKI